ncbi:hypothetical protein CSX04_00273 [Burkholderia cepacia]|nr:hypothetical protein CSX04_00273 [Burkholderia cepacia]
MKPTQALEFVAPRDDNARLANLCGPLDENLRQIEQALDVTLSRRGHRIAIRGRGAKLALAALENFYNRARDALSVDDIQLALVEVRHTGGNGRQDTLDVRFRGDPDHPFDDPVSSSTPASRTRSPRRSSTRGVPTCAAARRRSANT